MSGAALLVGIHKNHAITANNKRYFMVCYLYLKNGSFQTNITKRLL